MAINRSQITFVSTKPVWNFTIYRRFSVLESLKRPLTPTPKAISIPRGGVLPYERLMGMCRWMGSYFHDWTDYNGVALLLESLEWGRTFSDFKGKTVVHISS